LSRNRANHSKGQAFGACSFLLVWLALHLLGCAGGVPRERADAPPISPDTLTAAAAAAVASGDYPGAKSFYDEALAADPEHAPALRGLAELAVKTGDPVSAVSYYERLAASDASTPSDHIDLARALSDAGRTDDAILHLQGAAGRYPTSARIQSELGLLLLERGRTDDALPHLERAVALDGVETRTAHSALAKTLFEAKRFDEAAAALESYNQRYPGDFDVNMKLGYIHFQNGAYREALACYRSAVDARPESIDARVALAKTLERLERFDNAIRVYDSAIEIGGITPELEPVILAQANLLNKRGKYAQTLDLVERAAAVFPETAGLACARGMALAAQGRYAEAVKAFRAAATDPAWSEFANAQLRRIEQLRGSR
jgi:tetratricopeptide (TPR) repeat protein